jgi:mono/diheme cytochrome c family protein
MNVERNLILGTIATVVVVALLIIIYGGEEARIYHETKAQQGELIARGARLYDDYCAGCHGKRGEGLAGIYPPLNVEDLWSDRENIAFYGTLHDYIALNISAGHPNLNMPSWADEYGGPLRNDQVEDITQFVMNWMGPQPEGVRVKGAAFVAPPVSDTGIEPGSPAANGQQIYFANCASCHGISASGSDLGPTLVSSDVAAKDDGYFRSTITDGKPGTSMPTWDSVLSPEQIEDVIAFLRSKQQ